ncbi:carboxylic acid reductase [Acidocella sp. KAb 2-4]|uniref:carboxylic acid reductase n=1 Tax=Acidocella sp. KAb 2-4 TaxID=2885158 RepID=UPI001D0785D9|nr:carboxylic acid reductase [Acidocella sp. KAb 2-4]MCB5944270.1 thioester reductase domain-containing protein [Acidocella sp. KAb 2-4]
MVQEFNQQHLIEKAGARIWDMAEADPQLNALKPKDEVTRRIQEPDISYREIIAATLEGYAERPALGSRAYEIGQDDRTGESLRHYLPAFKTISYAELRGQVEGIANFWRHHPQHRVAAGDMVAFIAFTGAEMAAVDLACIYAQAVSVPLQANLSRHDMEEVLRDTAPVTMIANIDNLALATEYACRQDTIRSLIVIDYDSRIDAERRLVEAVRARLAENGGKATLTTFSEAVGHGGQFTFEPLPPSPRGRDNISMIMYTSGSTGTPKGALIHDAISIQFWSWMPVYVPTVAIGYAPMNHFMGRNMVHSGLAQGGTVYFTLKSDMSSLFEDIRIARPTFISFIPRVCELVYQHYQSEVQRRVAGGEAPEIADAAVRVEMSKSFLGDRLNAGGVGSSPTAPEVRQFMAECFDIPMIEGYGCTEAGGGALAWLNKIVPRMVVDYKLADVPELGYYTTDRPFPRGELLVKTTLMIQGYFKRPEASAAIFDADGYLKTGDVMEERGPGHLVWVDRRNNVIKLSQAEFVAIGPLEAAFLARGKFIRQIYVYGSSKRSFLLAVVVPALDLAQARLGHAPSDAELRELVLADLQEAARDAGLKSFEVPRDVLIEREAFTLENGLLSSVRKPLRPNLKRRYADRLEAMYQEMERQQRDELALLRQGGDGQSTLDRVVGAFKANLGLAALDGDNHQSYSDLGGDSFGAVSLSLLFEEMFGVSVPVSTVLHPSASASRLAAYIDDALGKAGPLERYKQIHPDPERVKASDFKLDVLFDAATLAAAKAAAPPVTVSKTVLLTGANGFLGRFLCLEWLEQLAKVDGKLICIIRGADAQAARARLDEAIGSLDHDLAARFRTLAARHLEMLVGDLATPKLGLDEANFARLADEVDHIVHPAALVNHRLSYRNLFEPNVLGTAELIRLALMERLKRFDYVSSVAVPHMSADLAHGPETMDVRKSAPEMPLIDMYASGYGASKWAGEVMLREVNEKFGLPVNVFRADMIMPHARYIGQINVTDMFTRLLFSLVKTGIAPKSFYELGPNGERQRAHYDGLPANFVAAAMQQIGARPYAGFFSYNLINVHHDDGLSLDTVVDWVESAGYTVKRIGDHQEWVRRFEDKLRNLPDSERQQSSLSILGHFAAPHPAHPMSVSSAEFQAMVKTIPAGPEVPQLSEGYIHKYLKDMRLLGLIEQPKVSAG